MLRKSAPILLFIALPLVAQDADPPSRVARLNLLSGSVSFRPDSVEEWTAASLNYPLTTGDHLWADAAGRVEMHVGSTAVRMSERTAMSVLNLDDRTTQLSLTEGSLVLRLRQLADDEIFEVDTPNVAITLLRPGDYRIDVDAENGVSTVTVRSGDAEVTGGGAAFPVHARQSARIAGTDNVSEEVVPPAPFTEFDEWCMARDRHEDEAQVSAQYVPRDMVGYEDLDDHGAWSEVPDYGWVWRPRVMAADWAPYRYGHWAWVEPWGWTWIDDAPWGFAPFHYGRWAMVAGGWVWVPGRMVVGARPVYAPALVVFVGGGAPGVAAWFPLGPHEVYRPAYHVSEIYVRRVNVTHVNVIAGGGTVYVNQRIPGAVTVVTHETFASARPVGRSIVAVDGRVWARGPVLGSAAPIPPQRASVLGHAGPPIAAPPARFVERPVVARRPVPPQRVSFAEQRQALEANQGRPLEPAQVERMRPAMPPRNPMVRTLPAPSRVDRPVNVAPPQRVEAPVPPPRPQRVEMPAPPARPQRVETPAPPARPAAREERRDERRQERQEEHKAAKKEKKAEEKKQ
jgi:hypothetical protein